MKRRRLEDSLLLIVLSCFASFASAKIVYRRNALDGALNATLIVIMQQQSRATFVVREKFLGDVAVGQTLLLPGFALIDEDRDSPICCGTKKVPFDPGTWILVFLRPASEKSPKWVVAGFGNCYFWTHERRNLPTIRGYAQSALALRTEWEAARDVPDPAARATALWPFLFNHDGACRNQTEAELKKIGPVAGESVAALLPSLPYNQRGALIRTAAEYGSPVLHAALIADLGLQQSVWEELARRDNGAKYDDIDPPGRIHYSPRRPDDADANLASDVYVDMFRCVEGIASFKDRKDLPLVRELARWAVQNRFKQVDDVALKFFGELPERENVAVIAAIWQEFSAHPTVGNDLRSYHVVVSLAEHKYPEATQSLTCRRRSEKT